MDIQKKLNATARVDPFIMVTDSQIKGFIDKRFCKAGQPKLRDIPPFPLGIELTQITPVRHGRKASACTTS